MQTRLFPLVFVLLGFTFVGCGEPTAANQIDISDEAAVQQHMQQVEDEERAHNQQMQSSAPAQSRGE